jgi:hypothetical protein
MMLLVNWLIQLGGPIPMPLYYCNPPSYQVMDDDGNVRCVNPDPIATVVDNSLLIAGAILIAAVIIAIAIRRPQAKRRRRSR